MKLSVIFLLMSLSVGNGFSQEIIGDEIVPKGKVRYISYPNNQKNRMLYDTIAPYGFYNMLQKTFNEVKYDYDIELQGISDTDLKLLAKMYGTEDKIPLVEVKKPVW